MSLLRDCRHSSIRRRRQLTPFSVVTLLLHTAALMQVSASGSFQLEVGPWRNTLSVTADGRCCEGGEVATLGGEVCSGPCRTFLRVCLSHYQAVVPEQPDCTYGSVVTGTDQFIRDSTLQHHNVNIPFEFAWPGSFSVTVEAWHDDTGNGPSQGSRRTLIWRLTAQRLLNATSSSDGGSRSWTSNEFRPSSALLPAVLYRYRAVCDEDFHGPGCTEFCRPRDDRFGHYNCDATGSKLCHSGWTGNFCHTPVCRDGCRGYCRKPFECRCRQGWKGVNCDECLTKPGCHHGFCVQPWQCICLPGWSGAFCNHELDYCSSHVPCQHGATCRNDGHGGYTCECDEGFSGTNCERDERDCRHHQRTCLHHGTCQYNAGVERYECQCAGGRVGARCQSMSGCHRHQQPCHNGGVCSTEQSALDAGRCLCPSGFTGRFCELDIDDCSSQPCVNGRCVDLLDGFRCVCALGYTGRRCDVNVDDCRELREPCLNGGSCLDGLDAFSCRCPPGYGGSLCQFRGAAAVRCPRGSDCSNQVAKSASTSKSVADCRSSPCFNGATCVDVDDDKVPYRCVCRRRFRGRRCRVQVAKPRHFKHDLSATTVSPTLNFSVQPVSDTSTIRQSSSVNSARQNLVVVVSPLAPVLVVVVAAAVVVAVVLTASTAVCVCLTRRRRRRRDVVAGRRPCHHGGVTTDWIRNDVKRPNNIASNCKPVANFHNSSDRL